LVPAWYGVSVSQSPDAGSTWGPPSPFLPHGRHKESIEVSSKPVGGTTFQVPAPLCNWCACVHNPREVEHMSPRIEGEFDLDLRVGVTLIQLATASSIRLSSSPCTLEVCHVGCTCFVSLALAHWLGVIQLTQPVVCMEVEAFRLCLPSCMHANAPGARYRCCHTWPGPVGKSICATRFLHRTRALASSAAQTTATCSTYTSPPTSCFDVSCSSRLQSIVCVATCQ